MSTSSQPLAVKDEENLQEMDPEHADDGDEDDDDDDLEDSDMEGLCQAPTHSLPAKRKMPDQNVKVLAKQPMRPAAEPKSSPKKLKQNGNPGTTEEERTQYKLCNICGHWLQIKMFPMRGSTCSEDDLARERIQQLMRKKFKKSYRIYYAKLKKDDPSN